MEGTLAFISAHPALMTAIVWPLLTAVLTTLFKPQTPEQYLRLAAKHPRLADFWRLVGALGLDPVKAVLLIRELCKPNDPPPPPPPSDPGGSLPLLITPIMVFVLACVGCGAPLSPKEKSEVADKTFELEMLRCVDDAGSREESQACRADVRAKWHVDGGAR